METTNNYHVEINVQQKKPGKVNVFQMWGDFLIKLGILFTTFLVNRNKIKF